MASILPITLSGSNLGERHQQLNSLVNDAYLKNIPLSSVLDLPEKTAVDRLFKIDLAVKYKNVEYILKTLKDHDMLYVSRALKNTWLLDSEYCNIINPVNLEDGLYPEMITTAITKMKRWIQLNLKNSDRCTQFYQYYISKYFDSAIKFLWNCPEQFILDEIPSILDKISPFHLKLLSAKCPEVAKIFFDSLESNDKVFTKYTDNEKEHYEGLKFLLKVNADIYLDITEKYFNNYNFNRFSSESTKYIMKNKKDRFNNKPELYTAWLLDIKTLAKCLSKEEIKDLVLKLARAKYLEHWFSYKSVEPLIKSLNVEERVVFKKQVFVDKSFGDMIENWPYKTPSSPQRNDIYSDKNVFQDKEHDPFEYEYLTDQDTGFFAECGFKSALKKRKYCAYNMESCDIVKRKSSLDLLFDRFRYTSFEKTLYDLQKQMKVENMQRRQNMMLVLVSKSGGRADSLEQFLKLLTLKHENEPENLRATIIRSLVRRCNAWRLPQNVWDMMIQFGRGVGLDGKPSTVACKEGLHAVVIRSSLLNSEVNEDIWNAFMKEFSTFQEYSLNAVEKQKISSKLPALLLNFAKNNPKQAIQALENILDILEAYKIRVDQCPDLLTGIISATKTDPKAELLLLRLFNARIGRKELIKQNFEFIQTDASYLNVLRHDASILATGEKFESLIKNNQVDHDKFLRALSLYFNEDGGLAQKYLNLLKKHVEESPKNKLAKPLVLLLGQELVKMLSKFNDAPKKSERRSFAAALTANLHLARPLIDLDAFGWQRIGAKAIANKVLICDAQSVTDNIEKLLVCSKTQRSAFILSLRVGKELDVLQVISEKRARLALKIVLRHSRTKKLNEDVWDIIIPIISNLESEKLTDRLRKVLSNIKMVPVNKRASYSVAVFEVLQKIDKYAAMPMLCNIENIISEVDERFIENLVSKFLTEEFTVEKFNGQNYSYEICLQLRFRIIAKYLLFCTNETQQQKRWENVGVPFFNHCEHIMNDFKKSDLNEYFNDFLNALKCNKVFLDTKYVSCLLILEKITNRLHDVFPTFQFYGMYVHMHLTMLYFKSVRQSIKNNPLIFEDLPKNLNLAAEIVGRLFGKYVAHEVLELMRNHFDSIRHIYKADLLEFIEDFQYGDSKTILIKNIVQGILECDDTKSHILAEHIFNNDNNRLSEKDREEIFEKLNGSKNLEVVMFLHANKET